MISREKNVSVKMDTLREHRHRDKANFLIFAKYFQNGSWVVTDM